MEDFFFLLEKSMSLWMCSFLVCVFFLLTPKDFE